jgi:hypothetical protein
MARKAEGTGKIRADLEGAMLALVDVEEVAPFIRKRIEQAVRRAGLDKLLGPALEDLDRVCAAAESAKAQVNAAMSKLIERQ